MVNEKTIKIGNLNIDGVRYEDATIGITEHPGTDGWKVDSTVPVLKETFKPAYSTWMQAVVAAENFAGKLRPYAQTG